MYGFYGEADSEEMMLKLVDVDNALLEIARGFTFRYFSEEVLNELEKQISDYLLTLAIVQTYRVSAQYDFQSGDILAHVTVKLIDGEFEHMRTVKFTTLQ